MTGIRLTATFDDARLARVIGDLTQLGRSPRGILAAIGVKLAAETRNRFSRGEDPAGRRWADYAPLNPLYAAGKYGPSILIGAGMRGGLQGSITSAVDGFSVVVGSNKVYAAIHQFGGTIRPKTARRLRFRMGGRLVAAMSVHIPARPYLGLSAIDKVAVVETLEDFLARTIARG